MNYFSSYVEAKSEQYVYTSLFDAEKCMAMKQQQKMKCHLYAVIHSIIFVNMLQLAMFEFLVKKSLFLETKRRQAGKRARHVRRC